MKTYKVLTHNLVYNIYQVQKIGAFATFPYYTVGRSDYADEFDLSHRNDLAQLICDKLNKEHEESNKHTSTDFNFTPSY